MELTFVCEAETPGNPVKVLTYHSDVFLHTLRINHLILKQSCMAIKSFNVLREFLKYLFLFPFFSQIYLIDFFSLCLNSFMQQSSHF